MAVNKFIGVAIDDTSTILGVAGCAAVLGQVTAGGGGWSPDTEGTLVRWINPEALGTAYSDNDPIGSAADQSGLGNNLTSSGAARPTFKASVVNGRPSILFVASNSTTLTGSAVAGSAKTSMIVYTADSDSRALMSTKSGIANYTNFGGAGYFAEWRSARADNFPATMPTSGVNILIIVSNGSGYEVFLNGSSAGTTSAAHDAGDVFGLGLNGVGGAAWNNYIHEYAEWNEAFNSTKVGQASTYAATRWQ